MSQVATSLRIVAESSAIRIFMTVAPASLVLPRPVPGPAAVIVTPGSPMNY